MKKTFFSGKKGILLATAFVCFCFIAIIFVLVKYISFSPSDGNAVVYKLNNRQYKLIVADTETEWQKGLMYRKKLENEDGMIFLFPEKDYRIFWNNNTYMDLDVYWLDEDRVVGQSYLPSIENNGQITTVSSPEKVNRVIEIPVNNP